MTRLMCVYIIVVSIGLVSCKKTMVLEPLSYPQFLRNEVSFVKCFDDGGLLVTSTEGVYAKMDDQAEFIFTPDEFSYLWRDIPDMRLYKSQGIIYGVNNEWIMNIRNGDMSFNPNNLKSAFLQPDAFVDYAIDNDGQLYAANYGEVETDSLSNNLYTVFIHRWNADSSWISLSTDITKRDSNLIWPSITFGESLMYVSLGNIYEIDIKSDTEIDLEKIVVSVPFQLSNIYNLKFEDGTLFGTDQRTEGTSYTFSLNLNTGVSNSNQLALTCEFNNPFQPSDEVLAISNGRFYYYFDFSNWNDEVNDGELLILNQKPGSCETLSIEIESFEYEIRQMDFYSPSNSLFLATTDGLKTYSLATGQIRDYLTSAPKE